MNSMHRRKFLRNAGVEAATLAMSGPFIEPGLAQKSPNET